MVPGNSNGPTRGISPIMSKPNLRMKRNAGGPVVLRPAALLLTFAALAIVAAIAIAAPVARQAGGNPSIRFSLSSTRSYSRPFAGQSFAATRRVYVFIPPSSAIARVSFYIDDPNMTSQPWTVTRRAPYDLNGTRRGGAAMPFDVGSLADIKHTVTAAITLSTGKVRVVSARFAVSPRGAHHYTRRVVDDEFSGKTVNTSNWFLYSGPGNAGRGLRSPSAVTVNGRGDLVITASMSSGHVVSGGLQWRSTKGYVYGHYEFRVKTEADPSGNMSGVVLQWPTSGQRYDGEEDYYETGDKRTAINVFLHHLVNNGTSQDYFGLRTDPTKWHTVAVDWQRSSMTIYVDGIRVYTDRNPAAMTSKPHRIAMQFDASTLQPLARPVHMYVDYVRFYQ